MKTLLIFCIIACIFGNWSCGRQKWIETRNKKTNVFLEISNQNEVVRLGDSLQLKLLLPDTILVEDLNNQSMYYEAIHHIRNNPARPNFNCTVYFLDTITKKVYSRIDENKIEYKLVSGEMVHLPQFSGGALNFSNRKPFSIEIVVKPTQRGLYYIQISPQPGILEYNRDNQISLVSRFNVRDAHLNLLAKIYTPNNPDEYFSSTYNYYSKSGGVYAFKVE